MLSIEHLYAGYDRAAVLHDVTLAVPSGCVVALIGPNGAGKTTLLRAASGLLPVSGGTVRLGDRDITGWRASRRARSGLCHVPEGRAVFPTLSVRANMELFGAAVGVTDAVSRGLDAFPALGDHLEQTAGSLSGGQQQMVALARAYLTEPTYVLLDEVSMGLAPVIVDDIYAFLRELRASGTALLLVEQYVDRVLELADLVYILDRGRIAFAGEPDELVETDVFASYLGGDLAATTTDPHAKERS